MRSYVRVEFIVEVEGEPLGVAICAPSVGQLEALARAAATRLADDAATHGQQALVYRLQKRWQRRDWVDGRRELVYDTAALAAPAPSA
jgi:hypothetical protein